MKIDTFEFEGEEYAIREASAYRTLAYSKAMRLAKDDEVKHYDLTAEYLRACVRKSIDEPKEPRWTEAQFNDEDEGVSIKLFNWLANTVKTFNGLDNEDPVAAAEAETVKNS